MLLILLRRHFLFEFQRFFEILEQFYACEPKIFLGHVRNERSKC